MRFNILLAIGMTATVVAAEAAADRSDGGWYNYKHTKRVRTRTRTRTGFATGTATLSATATPDVTDVPTLTTSASVPEPTGDEGEGEGEGEDKPVTSPTRKISSSVPSATGGDAPTATPTAPSTAPPASGDLWQPKVGASWQIILSTTVNPDKAIAPNVDVFDLDMDTTPKSVIDKLKAQQKKVICYFSAGSSENFRSDNSQLLPYVGKELEGWPGENWLDIKSAGVRAVMKARIARAAEKGCDAIDPDNMDGYGNTNGLGLTQADTVDYVKFLAAEAAAKGMSIGLKNAGDVIPEVLPFVQFSVNEQCNEYNECPTFAKFITAGKPVFNIEYVDSNLGRRRTKRSQRVGYTRPQRVGFTKRSGTCPGTTGFSSVVKNMSLDGWIKLCNGVEATTATGGGN